MIDVVPMKHSDSDSDSITVQMTDTGDTAEQQVTAQVAVLQAQATNNTGPHYITVTGKQGCRPAV